MQTLFKPACKLPSAPATNAQRLGLGANWVVSSLLTLAALVAFSALAARPAHATLPVESWTTTSGAKVLLMRADALPILDIRIDLPAGSRAEPKGQEGLAGVVANLLGRGAEGLSETQIADAFADTGAVFSSGAGSDSAHVQLRTLATQPERDQALALFATVLHKPVFAPEVFAREQARTVAGLKEALTKPNVLADRAFAQALYPQHPYGRVATEASLANISLASVQRFYAERYVGNHAVVSMVGNIDRAQAQALAERLTAPLPSKALETAPYGALGAEALQAQMAFATTAATTPATSVGSGNVGSTGTAAPLRIAHPALQSHILMGLPALRRGDPNFFDLLVANHVLGGGGFVSRLMEEIREKRGLAYSVYSYFAPSGDAGPFQAGLQTKNEQAEEATQLLRQTLLRFLAEGPTAAELRAAQQNLVGSFPLRIDSNAELLGNLSMMGVYGLPADYLDTWPAQVAKVTPQSAKAAFASVVKPSALVTVVVGGGVQAQPKP